MVLDTSAVAAILLKEPEWARLAQALDEDPVRLMSAATLLELGMVMETRRGGEGRDAVDSLLLRARVTIVPFDEEQARVARVAWRAFGKGRHPAALNFGDCCAYALAATSGEPLLFKGDDFARTDVTAVALPG